MKKCSVDLVLKSQIPSGSSSTCVFCNQQKQLPNFLVGHTKLTVSLSLVLSLSLFWADRRWADPCRRVVRSAAFEVTGGTYYFWSVLPAWEATRFFVASRRAE